jgi:hypothetical protein
VADGDVSLRYRLLGHDDASPAFNKVARSAEALHGTMSKVGMVLAGVAAGGVLALGAAMVQGVKDAQDYQTLQAKSAAVLKSTGNVAGTSVKQIDTLAASLETMSGVDETLIINSQNVLATFTAVRNEAGKGNDIFTQGTKAALNMSTALGTDLQASTIQLGKALQDPVKGITALQRVGVSFTAAQKDQIAAMVKSGDTMGAQKLILGELHKEFGGAAEAAGSGFGGAIARLKDVFSDAFRDLAIKYLPDLTRLANWLAAQAPGAIATMVAAFGHVQTAIKAAADIIIPTFNFIKDHTTVFGSLAAAIVGVTVAWKTVTLVMAIWNAAIVVAKAAQIAFIAVTQGQAAATRVATASQMGLNIALLANPIGLVVVALAALVAAFIFAYKNCETFRNIVNASWQVIKTVVMNGVRFVVDAFLSFADMIVGAAAAAFGWIPGIGPKLQSAAKAVHEFRNKVNAELAAINDRTVNIRLQVDTVTGQTYQAESKHRAMGGPCLRACRTSSARTAWSCSCPPSRGRSSRTTRWAPVPADMAAATPTSTCTCSRGSSGPRTSSPRPCRTSSRGRRPAA